MTGALGSVTFCDRHRIFCNGYGKITERHGIITERHGTNTENHGIFRGFVGVDRFFCRFSVTTEKKRERKERKRKTAPRAHGLWAVRAVRVELLRKGAGHGSTSRAFYARTKFVTKILGME